jgi:hypothetical protein
MTIHEIIFDENFFTVFPPFPQVNRRSTFNYDGAAAYGRRDAIASAPVLLPTLRGTLLDLYSVDLSCPK